MKNYCFLNGEIMPIEEAKVSVLDIGLMRGYGVYDGLAALGGKVFRFADHWQRFTDGAHALSLNVPITEESCEKKIREICEKSGLTDRANIRMILTGGNTVNGIEFDFEKPTFYITAEKFESLPKDYYKKGAKLLTYPYRREMPEHKTINYITGVKLQDWRKAEGAVEILYVEGGEVLECATSNICIIKDKTIITPAENVLRGITLKAVLEIAERSGHKTEKKIVDTEDLKNADEIFITSSFKDIVPIVKIDDFEVGNGQVGETTLDFMGRFAKILTSPPPLS